MNKNEKIISKLCKKLNKLDLKTGKIIKEYSSCSEAECDTGILHIDAVCRGDRNSAGGFGWEYQNQEKVIREGKLDSTPKKVNQIDITTGKIINTYASINNAQKTTGCHHLEKACDASSQGIKKFTGGFKWEYASDNDIISLNIIITEKKLDYKKTKIIQLDLENNYIKTFESIRDAAKSTNVKAPNISMCLNNKRNSSGGFKWKYFDNE